jgi:hypothetical protein
MGAEERGGGIYERRFREHLFKKMPEGYRLMVQLIFGYPVKDVQTAPPRDEEVIFNWIT